MYVVCVHFVGDHTSLRWLVHGLAAVKVCEPVLDVVLVCVEWKYVCVLRPLASRLCTCKGSRLLCEL